MQKAEKMQELRVFAQEIRVETLKTVGSLGFGTFRVQCPLLMRWQFCTAK